MTVRVIRGGGTPAPRGADFTPSARRIDAARYTARVESERTIAEARATAEEIVEAAKREAAKIRNEAEREGLERAHAKALALLQSAQLAAESASDRLLDLVLMATKAVTERALGTSISQNDEALRGWATQALATFHGARNPKLRANPRSIARLNHLRGVELTPDPELDEHTLVAHTDLGDARVELRAQVDAVVDAIAEVLAKEVHKQHG
jgi:flagellar biosynthesis/type III secretory pathway protein FliH